MATTINRETSRGCVQIDRQEEGFRQAERRKEVEVANLKLWEQTDRVRELRGRMLLSEILAERGLQIALRAHLQGLEKAEREQFHLRLLERIKVGVTSGRTSPEVVQAREREGGGSITVFIAFRFSIKC